MLRAPTSPLFLPALSSKVTKATNEDTTGDNYHDRRPARLLFPPVSFNSSFLRDQQPERVNNNSTLLLIVLCSYPFPTPTALQNSPDEPIESSRRTGGGASLGAAEAEEEESVVDGQIRLRKELHEEHYFQQLHRQGHQAAGSYHRR